MGKYDEITESELRAELVRFARLLLEADELGQVPATSGRLLAWIGELRQMLFAWEVRHTRRSESTGSESHPPTNTEPTPSPSGMDESLRVVREALERELELLRELEGDIIDGRDSENG